MRSRQVMLLGILCVLFFVAAASGQEQSDSHIITVTKKIDVAKLNENVENLTKTVEGLTKTVEKLNETVGTLNTTVGGLEKTVARIDERTDNMRTLQFVILAAILGGPLVTILVSRRFSKDNEGANTVDRLTEQITNLTSAQAENSNQIAKLTSSQTEILERISAQAAISETRDVPGHPEVPSVERVDELTDDIRSPRHDTMERV